MSKLIKYLCIIETTDNIELGIRELEDYFYLDINKNDLYINIHKVKKDDFTDLLQGMNKKNQKQTYLAITTSIITDFLTNVKLT